MADHDVDKMRKELNETRKHYQEFRKKVRNLDVEQIMSEEKSFCVFGAEDRDASKVDEEILYQVKLYKNCHPDDVEILKGMKLKLSNYLLKGEADALASVRKSIH